MREKKTERERERERQKERKKEYKLYNFTIGETGRQTDKMRE